MEKTADAVRFLRLYGRGDLEAIKECLATLGFDPNCKTSQGEPILHRVIQDGNLKVARLLLDLPGIDVDEKNPEKETALDQAVIFERPACFGLLLAHGAKLTDKSLDEIENKEAREDMYLFTNLVKRDGQLGRLRLQTRFDKSFEAEELIEACKNDDWKAATRALKRSGIDPNVRDFNDEPVICLAIRHNSLSVLKVLLAHPDIDLEELDKLGHNLIESCLRWENGEGALRLLVKHPKCDLENLNEGLFCPLHYAIQKNRLWALKIFLEVPGINVDRIIVHETPETAMSRSIEDRKPTFLKWLIAYGAKEYEMDDTLDNEEPKDAEILDIISKYERLGEYYRKQLRKELGISDAAASQLFSFIIFHCENLMQLKEIE